MSLFLAKSPWQQFHRVFLSFWEKLIWKLSPWLFPEILGVFLNTLTADDKYPVEHWENLQHAIEMELSQKRKAFSDFFFHLWNLHQILNIFKKKMMVIANVFRKLETVNNFVRPLCENPRFGTRFDSQHVKVSPILAKSPWEHFYHVFLSNWEKLILKMSPLVLGKI